MTALDFTKEPGRPREFDLDEIVTKARNVFWDRGYRGSSLAELLAGTGLTRGSLYKAFKSKKQLFLLALDSYARESYQQIQDTIQTAPSVRDGVQRTLIMFAEQSHGEPGRRGCLVVATATEMSGHDAEIAARVKNIFQQIHNIYASAIKAGQDRGEIDPTKDSGMLARYIVTQIEGFRVLGKVDDDLGPHRDMIDLIMTALD